MSNLIIRKLQKNPIGTHVELTCMSAAAYCEKVCGILTDIEKDAGVEITTYEGNQVVLDASIILGFQVTKAAEPVPQALSAEPPAQPVVPEPAGVKLTLAAKHPEDFLNLSDSALKEAFEKLPKNERKLLNSAYERFKYGVKISEKDRMATGADQARQCLFLEDARDYEWSGEAVRFCGALLRRVNLYDHEVFVLGECFREAAYACWKEEELLLAGVFACLSVIEETPVDEENLGILLAKAVVETGDASALPILLERMPASFRPRLTEVVGDALRSAGLPEDGLKLEDALAALCEHFPADAMGEELASWLPEEVPETAQPESEALQPSADENRLMQGVISRYNWASDSGVILGDNGTEYLFGKQDLVSKELSRAVCECMRTDLGGKTYTVEFTVRGGRACNIRQGCSLVERARSIAANTAIENRFEQAFELCREAISTRTDVKSAVSDLIGHALALNKATEKTSYISEAVKLYEKNAAGLDQSPYLMMNLAKCYERIRSYSKMLQCAQKAVTAPNLKVRQKLMVLTGYCKLLRDYSELSGDKSVLRRLLDALEQFDAEYGEQVAGDADAWSQYNTTILPSRIVAECALNMAQEAEADLAGLSECHSSRGQLEALVAQTVARLNPLSAPEQEHSDPIPAPEPDSDPQPQPEEEPPEEDVRPYVDTDGWDALGLSKKDVVDYAMHITGPDRIPAITAYLSAGALLNSEIAPVYHVIAMAVNDPMEAPDYSVVALQNALSCSDSDYPELNDCCMGAAFLRASFLSGRGYGYSSCGLRDSIAISQRIPSLRAAYDTLERFRQEAGRAIDIYADYRNHNQKKLKDALANTRRRAGELYQKFILTPARDNASFARLLETKRIVFARDGELAAMLRSVMDQDNEALEQDRERFAETYLTGPDQFTAQHIRSNAVDRLITECWDEAGKNLMMRKQNATLQGDRRNNLRSNIIDILATVCEWYAISEESSSLTWRTPEGEAAYLRLRPQLISQLCGISEECEAEIESCPNAELSCGLFILSQTARELSARLDGSWKFGQEKYFYADFLRTSHVLLNESFMPDLTSTFCILDDFNILARIRRHVEEEKLSFRERIDQIYGTDRTCNNYGTAEQIREYLEAIGESDSVTFPENADEYAACTEMQANMRLRNFRETYALASSYGQVIKNDDFCHRLEDTVSYWYTACRAAKNYGFFISVVLHAEKQIHASARQYELQLDEQLDALIARNQAYFDEHSHYAEAIREQIANHNFTVAEDWMGKIRVGDFSLDVQQPEALTYLDRFRDSSVIHYRCVADPERSLSDLLKDRVQQYKDRENAKKLIGSWPEKDCPSNPDRVGKLLNLLGWQNIRVSPYRYAPEPRGEYYEVRKEIRADARTTPQHPIAAFGSELEKKPMYVACLYGNCDCDRLYESMRSLNALDGSKIFLVDFAVGQADRRALARRIKKRESGLRDVNLVIDRVLLSFLAENYNESLINRILMATAMPFAYCQPYVVESIHTMPPEIFIGRKDELLKIERPDGVNLIYGGRQLGKSALFKKALADIDGFNSQRAVLVDIKDLDCAGAARKISGKLIDLNITPDAEQTDDWDVLCRTIERRLRSEDNDIKYFLLMLDEADAFINDCANCGYRPLVALKDVQQSLPGKFKYVLAGLHNIVKFNRQVALGNNSVITHMPSLKITPFRTPEAQELLTYPLSFLGFSLPSKVTVSLILATCNYFPGLIQLYAKNLIESLRAADYAGYDVVKTPPYVVSDDHLRRVMSDKEFVEQLHQKFEITLTLDEDQGSCYYPLALLIGWMYYVDPCKNGYAAQDVLRHARDLRIRPLMQLDEEKIEALLQELQDLNILRSVSDNTYLLASKNFRDLLGSMEEIFEKLEKIGGAAE